MIRQVLHLLSIILFGLVLVPLLVTLLAPAALGVSFHMILSESMTPTLQMGGVVLMQPIDADEVRVGDIIAFHAPGVDTPVCHRVVQIVTSPLGPRFVTRGDAVDQVDNWLIPADQLMGRIIFHIPGVGFAVRAIKTPYGFALLMGLPAVGLLVLQFKSTFQPEVRKRPQSPSLARNGLGRFVPFVAGGVVMAMLWGMSNSNTQRSSLGALRSSQPPDSTLQRTLRNHGSLPLVMCVVSSDPDVEVSPSELWLRQGEQQNLMISGGSGQAVITIAGYLPLLPESVICDLVQRDITLAPLVLGLTGAVPVAFGTFLVMILMSHMMSDRRDKLRWLQQQGYW